MLNLPEMAHVLLFSYMTVGVSASVSLGTFEVSVRC